MRKGLSDKAKMVYAFINGFWDGDCKASNEFIARIMATTPRTIQRAVSELKDKDLIMCFNVADGNGRIVGRIMKIKGKRNEF